MWYADRKGPQMHSMLTPKDGDSGRPRGKSLPQRSVAELRRGLRCHGPDRVWGPIHPNQVSQPKLVPSAGAGHCGMVAVGHVPSSG